MKIAYEKLLLCICLLIFAAGIAFYIIKNISSPLTQQDKLRQSSTLDYEPIPIPTFVEGVAVWPNAEEQAPGELYDVFTPPSIWIDDNGNFIFESIDPKPQVPFGIYLAELDRELYRIQLEGYVEEDIEDPLKSVLLFYDEEQNQRIRARVGDFIRDHEFSIRNFTIDRIRNLNGDILKLAVVTIFDHRYDRRIFLTHGERRYKDNVSVVFRSKEHPSFEIKIIQKPPHTFRSPSAKYTLEKINLEESGVTVKKLGDINSEPETRNLYLNLSEKQNRHSNPLEPEANITNNGFNFDF